MKCSIKQKILLKDMFDKAIEDNYLVRNPMKGVKLPMNKPTCEKKSFNTI